MERNNQISVLTSSSAVVTTSQSIVAIRQDREHFPRYKSVAIKERQRWLAKQFFSLASISRVKDYTADEASIGAVALDERIAESDELSDLTFPEIEFAFKTGVFGGYGEYYGLNAISLYKFLQCYYTSEKKQEATKEIQARLEAQRKAEEEAERVRMRERIEEMKRSGEYVPSRDFSAPTSFKLKSVEGAIDSSAHRAKIQQQARDILSGRLKI